MKKLKKKSKQKVLNSMIKENPNIKTLINSLNLQIIKNQKNEYTENIR